MKHKKNNAVEKVENIANGREYSEPSLENESEILSAKEQKENKMAEMRLEKARIKARKKAEKEKTKEMRRREKEKKKAVRLENKEQKKQRKKQIKANKERMRNSQNKKSKDFGGWLAAVITLGVATLLLSSALTFVLIMPKQSDMAIESLYGKAFYDVVDQVDNMDLNLSKTLATKDKGAMQTYLVDLAINSELAESDVQQLPLQDESKFYTAKLINQIGDFAKYLNKKLINNEELSALDKQNLHSLYKANAELKESLQQTISGMKGDFNFSSLQKGGNGNIVIENFNKLQNLSLQYPELIYDGPFSDSVNRIEIKGLSGEEISKETAKEKFTGIFAEYGIENVQNVGETNASLKCYNLQGEVKGLPLYAQISEIGGELIMFSYAGSCNKTVYGETDAIASAEKFLSKLNITGVTPVWINLSNNLFTINFAFNQNGIIIYSDLVKVRVCAETNMVIGLEASSYYTNHTKRDIETAKITKKQAAAVLSENISVEKVNKVVIPFGLSAEKLCYEFYGKYDDNDYYVYIDALTGKQLKMFKVIQSGEGKLLL